jgi:3-oxoacyl-[acyl-carrier-protein] synthase-1
MENKYITVSPDKVVVSGVALEHRATGKQLLSDIYREKIGNYPKFFKMDLLCKLGFVASELLIKELDGVDLSAASIVIFNRSSSYHNDWMYQQTIKDNDNFFPSPSIFVYTLPNIVTGEIAIRNRIYGETSFYLLENFDPERIAMVVSATMADNGNNGVICGWLDCYNDNDFNACLAYFSDGMTGKKTIEETFEKIKNI